MRNNTLITLIILLIISICFGCKKGIPDTDTVVNPITSNIASGQVTITGTVTASDGSVAANTTISIGAATITTDAYGVYSFTGIVADTNKLVIKFSKAGYIDTWQTFAVETGAIYNNINATIYSPASSTFNSTTGGTVSISSIGLNMTFAANSIIKDDGTAYTGTVTVEMPNAIYSIDGLLPGDGRAIDASNNQVVLEPSPGWYFDLKGQAGEVLKLSKPMTYSCAWKVTNAPASIKLWYFNTTTGLWAESASAFLGNQTYVGSTTNVGFMQLAVPYASTLLRLTVKDTYKNIPAGFKVQSSRATASPYDYVGYQPPTAINSKGICLVYVPASIALNLTLISSCLDRAVAMPVQALMPGVKTEMAMTPILTSYITSVTGRVEDCTFQPLNGHAQLNVNGVIYTTTLVNGAYTFNVIACGTRNAILTVYDANNNILVQNPYIALTAGSVNQAQATSSCTTPLTGNFTYTVAGQTYTFNTPKDTITYSTGIDQVSGKIYTMIRANGSGIGCYLTSLNTTAGTYEVYTGGFSGTSGNSYFVTWGLFTPGTITYSQYKTGTTIAAGTFKANTTLNFCAGCANTTVEVDGTFNLQQ